MPRPHMQLGVGDLETLFAKSKADVKVLKEFAVRNRPQGTTTWVRLNLRLD